MELITYMERKSSNQSETERDPLWRVWQTGQFLAQSFRHIRQSAKLAWSAFASAEMPDEDAAAHPHGETADSIGQRAQTEASYQGETTHTAGCSNPAAEERVQRILAGIREAREQVAIENAAYAALHPGLVELAPEPQFLLDGQTGYFFEELASGSLLYAGQAARQVWA